MSTVDTVARRRPPRPVARILGGALILLVAAVALLGPRLVPGDPYAQSLTKALAWPEAVAPLGYDHLGRSVFHRLASALRLSPLIALAAVAAAGTGGCCSGRWRRHGAGGPTTSSSCWAMRFSPFRGCCWC